AVAIGFGGLAAPIVGVAVLAVAFTQRRQFASLGHGKRAGPWRAVVQAWWAPVAGLLGLMMVVSGIGTIFEASNWGGRIVGSSLLLAFGSAMFLGLMRRPFDRGVGDALILLATIPALVFFWVIVPPLAAVLVWIGVLSSGFSERPAAPVA
ncbi:MAG: hypothetical protein LC733_13710, partial [Actinobacteria bacterium]|nr:hypothetical protein [Actinomycetota bacterium]